MDGMEIELRRNITDYLEVLDKVRTAGVYGEFEEKLLDEIYTRSGCREEDINALEREVRNYDLPKPEAVGVLAGSGIILTSMWAAGAHSYLAGLSFGWGVTAMGGAAIGAIIASYILTFGVVIVEDFIGAGWYKKNNQYEKKKGQRESLRKQFRSGGIYDIVKEYGEFNYHKIYETVIGGVK